MTEANMHDHEELESEDVVVEPDLSHLSPPDQADELMSKPVADETYEEYTERHKND
ncbi:hypothetical protein [Arthrobacter antioxidans]|uniref:hypothetical protein n=1 Tax=Arthrobacter antioxidans TaxID=2895818 RepID=UPI001FFE2DA6|nr:hypothetical protein [Arthrobacter antioxidans]